MRLVTGGREKGGARESKEQKNRRGREKRVKHEDEKTTHGGDRLWRRREKRKERERGRRPGA